MDIERAAAYSVTIADTGASFVCEQGMTILDGGLIAGIDLPHVCRNGSCGTCKSQVIEGEVDHGWVKGFAITEPEKAAGKCLICQSKPASDRLVIRLERVILPGSLDRKSA